ncbi:hypothetical protein CBM2585_A10093 [Cupriavidus taiwanensis]|nr:hypothetical protein CBM2585_A10093 [Cupriavidus taiwanensis]
MLPFLRESVEVSQRNVRFDKN